MKLKTILKVYLTTLCKNHERNIATIVRAKKNKILFDYIMKNTVQLTINIKRKCHMKTYIYWFLNDILSFDDPRCICDECNKPLKHRNVTTIDLGYYRYKGSDHKYCDKCRYFVSQKQKNKRIETWKKNYNTDHPMKNPEVVKRMEDRIEQKNGKGIRNVFQIESVKEKMKQSNLRNSGVEYSGASPEKILQTMFTNLFKYGCTSNLSTIETRKKSEETWFQNYGFRRPPVWKYNYDGKSFDSSPELAYYIWLKDNNIDFIYQPDVDIKIYDKNGKYIGKYYPDFLLCESNQLVEIKGDQFFDSSDNPINPYDGKSWKEKYDWIINNNVVLLREKDYMKYVKYCQDKFGTSKWKDRFKGKAH